MNIKTDPTAWRDADWDGAPDVLERLRKDIVLADGGIYDNMGIESLNESVKLISDAGAPFSYDESPRGDYFSQLGRVRDILIDQTRALRKRHLMEDFEAQRERGAYWGVGTAISHYTVDGKLAADNATTAALETMPTRLASVEPDLQGRLINWGYALADAALRAPSRANLSIATVSILPRPAAPLN